MITTFKYQNAKNEVETRRVLVIHQNEMYVQGFDLRKLDRKEQNIIKKCFGNKTVSTVKFDGKLDYDVLGTFGITKALVSKSYRNFKTANIF